MSNDHEYLRELQSKFDSSIFGDIEAVILHRKGQLNLSDESIKNIRSILIQSSPMVFLENFYKEYLVKSFLDLLSDDVKQRLENVIIGILPTFRVNASAIKSPSGTPLVIIHAQLLTAILHYNESQFIAAKLMNSLDSKMQIKGKELLIESCQEIVKCFKHSQFAPKMSMLPNVLNEEEQKTVYAKTLLHELFIIAHEFAHIYLGHLEKLDSNREYCPTQEYNITEYVREQKMELAADLQAATWIMEASRNPSIDNYPMLLMLKNAPYVSFESFMFMHLVEVNMHRFKIKEEEIEDLQKMESARGMISIALELDQLLQGTTMDSYKHPKALVRLLNIIIGLSDEFDENLKNHCLEMIYNALDFRSFAVGDGI